MLVLKFKKKKEGNLALNSNTKNPVTSTKRRNKNQSYENRVSLPKMT
jgi:hypothetical protein